VLRTRIGIAVETALANLPGTTQGPSAYIHGAERNIHRFRKGEVAWQAFSRISPSCQKFSSRPVIDRRT